MSILTLIIVEEVRDLRYIPLIGSSILTVFGLVLNLLVIPSSFMALVIFVLLSFFAILFIYFFIRDFLKIKKIKKDTELISSSTKEFTKSKIKLKSDLQELNKNCCEKINEVNKLIAELKKALEVFEHG
jgi:sensor histidine kinase YesM